MKKILYIIGLAAVLASCSKEQDEGTGNGSYDRVPIEFGCSIEATSRAIANNATQFAAGDKIGIIGCRADAAGKTIDFSAPFLNKVEFNYGNNKFTPTTANPAAYWQLGKYHNFYAYYPSTLNIIAGGNGVAPTSTLSVVAGTGIANDVMHAKVENGTKFTGTAGNTALLAFEHKLSKVRFRVLKEKAADANPVLNKVEFTMAHTAGTYNVATGAVTLGAASAVTLSKTMSQTVTTTTATDVNAEWTVLPADALSGITLTIGTQVLAATIAGGAVTTTAGKITVITLTIKSSGPLGVEFTSATLEDWGNVTGSGEVGPPPPKVGDYYYSDKSFSTAFSVPSGATLLGMVYKVNADNKTGMLVDIKEGVDLTWGQPIETQAWDMDDGRVNMATIKTLDADFSDYPAFKYCADRNTGGVTGWYLPARKELLALCLAYDSYGKPAFNTLMTAANGVVLASADYWSSTEYHLSSLSWAVDFQTSYGGAVSTTKPNILRVRCVRAF